MKWVTPDSTVALCSSVVERVKVSFKIKQEEAKTRKRTSVLSRHYMTWLQKKKKKFIFILDNSNVRVNKILSYTQLCKSLTSLQKPKRWLRMRRRLKQKLPNHRQNEWTGMNSSLHLILYKSTFTTQHTQTDFQAELPFNNTLSFVISFTSVVLLISSIRATKQLCKLTNYAVRFSQLENNNVDWQNERWVMAYRKGVMCVSKSVRFWSHACTNASQKIRLS